MIRLRRTITAFVLALAVLPLSAAAVPADTTTPSDAITAKAEVLQLLNSDSFEAQEQAIRLIGHYAHTDQFDEDFYGLMVTPLQYIVANSPHESLRIMAVSALYSIGTDSAMRGLQAQVDAIDSERVAKVAKDALAQYATERARAARTLP